MAGYGTCNSEMSQPRTVGTHQTAFTDFWDFFQIFIHICVCFCAFFSELVWLSYGKVFCISVHYFVVNMSVPVLCITWKDPSLWWLVIYRMGRYSLTSTVCLTASITYQQCCAMCGCVKRLLTLDNISLHNFFHCSFDATCILWDLWFPCRSQFSVHF